MTVNDLILRAYRRYRGFTDEQPDFTLSPSQWVRVLVTRTRQRLRAALRLYPTCFIGKRVTISNRDKLVVGKHVVIADGVELNALSTGGISLADNVTIDSNAVLRGTGVIRHLGTGIRVGHRTAVGAFNVLLGQGGIDIGCDCLLAPFVTVVSENHSYADRNRAIREQGEIRTQVIVNDDVWVGAGATILSGVTIGTGAVVAAGAVVTEDVEAYTVVGGVPARQIGRR